MLLLWLLPVAGGQAASPDEVFPRPLRVVMDRNHPPFIHVDATGKIQGILADQWLLWQEKTGIPVEITGLDRHDALSEMRAGRFDVIDTPFVTEEGQEWLEFGKPYADVEVAIFFHENIGGISDIRSLRGFVVGAKEGDAAVEQLRSEGINSLMLFKGYEAMIEAALEHKINVFVADKPPAAYYLDKHGVRSDFKLSAPINIGEFHRAVRRGSGGLLTEVEAGFARISTEELERIDKKWSIPP
ncbi:MAG: transporter substrate-binding domain-containing protein, partial [Proteobacteria bacterium]|nr:transporter substrate-binding domain-containing protein [Pseudomonadota bacterium]